MKYREKLLANGFIPLAMDGSVVTFDSNGRPSTDGLIVWVQPMQPRSRASEPRILVRDA
jgi:hypothetical protein